MMSISVSINHVITATVAGQSRSWEYSDSDKALMAWKLVVESGLVPGSNEPASDLVLVLAGSNVRIAYPNGGWEGPRAKADVGE